MAQQDDLIESAENFVLKVQELITEYGAEKCYNMDQSGNPCFSQ